jgi:tRNA G46 methylase TrmB
MKQANIWDRILELDNETRKRQEEEISRLEDERARKFGKLTDRNFSALPQSPDNVVATNGLTLSQPTEKSFRSILSAIEINKPYIFIDLGSGTGTVCFHMAVNEPLCVKAIGFELNEAVYEESVRRKAILGVDNCEFYQKDIFTLSKADLLEIQGDSCSSHSRHFAG